MREILLLSALVAASALTAPLGARPAVAHRATIGMAAAKVLSIDQDGIVEGRPSVSQKPPLKLLGRLEELQLLSSLSEAGLLSSAEEAGIFSKLEAAGAFSTLESLLPLADDLKVLSTLEGLLNVDAAVLAAAGAALLLGEGALLYAVPDDSAALVALQAVTGLLAGGGAVTLFGISSLFSLLQTEG